MASSSSHGGRSEQASSELVECGVKAGWRWLVAFACVAFVAFVFVFRRSPLALL